MQNSILVIVKQHGGYFDMHLTNVLKFCIGLFGVTVPLLTYADCPSASQIVVQDDGTFLGQNEQGAWAQALNDLTDRASPEIIASLNLKFVYGIRPVNPNEFTGEYHEMICAYRVANHNYKFLLLRSTVAGIFTTISPPNETNQFWEGWKEISQKRSVCIANYTNEDGQILARNLCSFRVL